ncbi:ATP-dependent DNA helicase PIF1-like protein [Tanacetum coccineum]
MAILAPTHDEVDKINDRMISLLPGEERVFYSSDTICQLDMDNTFDERLYSTDFLNTIKISKGPSLQWYKVASTENGSNEHRGENYIKTTDWSNMCYTAYAH